MYQYIVTFLPFSRILLSLSFSTFCNMMIRNYSHKKTDSITSVCNFDIHGSVHRRLLSRNTNKLQFFNRIYYSKVY
jgi:hypothetical protein